MLEVYIPNKTSSPMIAPEMTKRSQFSTLQSSLNFSLIILPVTVNQKLNITAV